MAKSKGFKFSKWLNNQTKSNLKSKDNNPSNSQSDVYNKQSGRGVLARFLPDGEARPRGNEGVAATFLHQDVVTPNQTYSVNTDNDDWVPYPNYANLLAVAKNPNQLGGQGNFSKARGNESWGYGVFYAHDSNSVDLRAVPFWNNKNDRFNKRPDGFKAPGYWGTWNNNGEIVWYEDLTNADGTRQNGSGNDWLNIGNPGVEGPKYYGLGTGIHVENNYIDAIANKNQEFSWPNSGYDKSWLHDGITGWFGELDYNLKGNNNTWKAYVDTMTSAALDTFKVSKIGDLDWNNTPTNQGWLDAGFSWVNNPTDMINIQNSFYLNRKNYLNKKQSQRSNYWGWNEVPTKNAYWNNANNIKGSIITLPLNFKGKKINKKSGWKKIKNKVSDLIDQYKNYVLDDGNSFDVSKFIDGKPIAFAQTLEKPYGNSLFEMTYTYNNKELKGDNFTITSEGILDIF